MEKYRLLPSEECLTMTQLMALDTETSVCSYRTCLLQTVKKSALFSGIKRKWIKKNHWRLKRGRLTIAIKIKDLKVHCFLQRYLDFQGGRYLLSDFLGANMITLPIRPGCAGIILLLLWQSALLFQGVTVNRRFLWIGFAWSKYYPIPKNWIVQPVRCAIPGMLHKYISLILPCWREETTLMERFLIGMCLCFNCASWHLDYETAKINWSFWWCQKLGLLNITLNWFLSRICLIFTTSVSLLKDAVVK